MSDSNVADELLFAVADGVATFTINRPDKRNSFTDAMVVRWVELLDDCRADPDVKVIVFTGSETSFSSGGDMSGLKDKAEQTPLAARERMIAGTQSLIRAVFAIDKPIIAAVNGSAVGGGMDIALMCDVRLAARSARFAETYAKMGLVPGVGGAWLLPRIVGLTVALDLFWTARWVDTDEALRLGLVNHVYSDDTFRDDVAAYARSVAAAAPLAVTAIKRLAGQALTIDLPTHLDALASHIAIVRTSDDHKEAVAAFREKRPPSFTGR